MQAASAATPQAQPAIMDGLLTVLRKIYHLEMISELLQWDEQTMLPSSTGKACCFMLSFSSHRERVICVLCIASVILPRMFIVSEPVAGHSIDVF